MAQWGNTDDAANSVTWAAAQLNAVANSANKTALFGNVTTNAFVTYVKTGVFGVDTDEMAANGSIAGVTHSGWVLRTEGTGGRAGRVQQETLVAFGTLSGDGDDDDQYPDA